MSTPMQRPDHCNPAILEQAAREIAQDMRGLDGDLDAWIADIADALAAEAPVFDAYRIGKVLEHKHGWDVDMDTVQALDAASCTVSQLVRAATAQWVAQCAIRPQLVVGDLVCVLARDRAGRKAQYLGEIVEIDEVHATYTVMIAELGHVREGTGTYGVIVPYEQLHELAAPPESFTLSMG